MVITFEKNGVAKISDYSTPKLNEVEALLHRDDIREQMTATFKELCGKTPTDNTIGWALEEITQKKFRSRITNIQFHHGKTLKNFGVKFG